LIYAAGGLNTAESFDGVWALLFLATWCLKAMPRDGHSWTCMYSVYIRISLIQIYIQPLIHIGTSTTADTLK